MSKLLLLLILSFTGYIGNCCSCGTLLPITETDYKETKLILRGKVIKHDQNLGDYVLTIRVDTLFKGRAHVGSNIQILSLNTCNLPAQPGQEWLVFANTDGNRYWTSLCSRSAQLTGIHPSDSFYIYTMDRVNDDLSFLRNHSNEKSEQSITYLPIILIGIIGLGVLGWVAQSSLKYKT